MGEQIQHSFAVIILLSTPFLEKHRMYTMRQYTILYWYLAKIFHILYIYWEAVYTLAISLCNTIFLGCLCKHGEAEQYPVVE